MPSKRRNKNAAEGTTSKRASFPRRWDCTTVFEKAWDRHFKAGRLNLTDLKAVMALLISNDGPLPPQYKDHPLHDDRKWKGCRECHVHGDFLLVYRLMDEETTVIFLDVGTHADLFD